MSYRTHSEDPHTHELTLHFTDGTRATCDVLVGADGIRSVTRGVMYRRLVESGEVVLAKVVAPSKDGSLSAIAHANEDAPTPTVKVEKDAAMEAEAETERDPVADFVDPVWSGTLVYRALIPKAALDRRWPGHRAGLGPVCVSVFFFLLFCLFSLPFF